MKIKSRFIKAASFMMAAILFVQSTVVFADNPVSVREEESPKYDVSEIIIKYEENAKNFHMDHFRENRSAIHNISMRYFIDKHQDERAWH